MCKGELGQDVGNVESGAHHCLCSRSLCSSVVLFGLGHGYDTLLLGRYLAEVGGLVRLVVQRDNRVFIE